MVVKGKDFLSGKRFKIEGVYGLKIYHGELVRGENSFTVYLDSEFGVLDWVEEQSPYVRIEIIDLINREDVTEDFVGNNVEFVKSRHDMPLVGGTLKDVYK